MQMRTAPAARIRSRRSAAGAACAEAALGGRFVAMFATPPARCLLSDAGVE
jgi:hypothetical protein